MTFCLLIETPSPKYSYLRALNVLISLLVLRQPPFRCNFNLVHDEQGPREKHIQRAIHKFPQRIHILSGKI